MTPEDWERLQAAFDEALALESDAERAEFVAELRTSDPTLADELQRMLDADVTGDNELLDPVHQMAASLTESGTDRWVGETLGNYRIIRKIAVGGMSAVYLAERADEQFDQEVAVKIVGSHTLSDELKTRFRTERQILASLKHPNIAQLYDGGETEDGMPFLVMEYIEGVPVDEYCDTHRLNIEDRLKLFTEVCSAVDYAHRNLVVHRDIKPSNILVTEDGVPKLLDFGIAKPLETAQINQTIAVTHASMRAMTPEFASPEQVRGEPITTATDVYSLGVLLYKLLSGRMPYLLKDRGIDSFVKAICETAPSKPSTVITLASEENDGAPAIVAQRNASISGLRRILRGDLDNIALATLQKEPERRYPSARALSDDIARFLANEPVTARPDSFAYRAQKFVSRHRAGVTSGVIVAAVIVGLVSYYTWQLTMERDRAEAEATKATQVVEFLTGVFRSASPYHTKGEDITVREVLSRGAAQLETDLADQPEILTELLTRIALIHQDLAMFEEARVLYDRSLELARTTYGESDTRVAAILMNISSARREAFELEEALQLANEALAIAENASPPQPRWVAAAWDAIGDTYVQMNRNEEAVEAARKSLDIYETLLPEFADEYAMTMHDYASNILSADGPEAALPVAEEAYTLILAAIGDTHPAVANNLTLRAIAQGETGNVQESERLYREALAMRRNLFGDDHPDVGISINRLAGFLSMRQRWGEIEPMLDEALVILEAHFPPEHFWVSSTKGMLSEVYSETGRTEEALALAEEWLQVSRAQFGDLDWTTAIAYAEYGDALLEGYRDEEAIAAFRNSITAFEANDGGLATDYTRAKLGRALLMAGESREAADAIPQALAAARTAGLPQHSIMARILVAQGELDIALANFDAARVTANEALEIFAVNGQDGSTWYWMARTVIAGALLGEGRQDDARSELGEVIAGLKRDNGTKSRAENVAQALLDSIDRNTP